MKLIREAIDFKRGQGSKDAMSVGMDSLAARTRRTKNLEKKIRFIQEESEDKVIGDIDEYENALENIISKGIDPENIKIVLDAAKFNFPTWRVIQGNHVNHIVFSENDADHLMAILSKYDIDKDPEYTYSEIDTTGTYFSIEDLKDFWERRGWKWED